ncbi:TaqI-like C-terminal specificity domain-containing protein [Clostridium thailandense]|nr:TaqI-like C-terminal specificity domain-containing protein [Clostridium thailandense]
MNDKEHGSIVMGKDYEQNMDMKTRKDYGRFYTPDFIIDYIIENTIKNIDIEKNPFVKILDPACGSGYFLVRIYDLLIKKFLQRLSSLRQKYYDYEFTMCTENGEKKVKGIEYWTYENLHYHIIKNCIYGSDIDDNAVELAKINLSSKSTDRSYLSPNIICCDTLIKYEEDYNWKNIVKTKNGAYLCEYVDIEGVLINKELSYTENKKLVEICEFWSERYDYIVGNPPWVSLSRKHKGDIKKKLIRYYISKYQGNSYLPNLYEYFIKRSFELAKNGGVIGFVVPDRFANNLQYKSLRKKILDEYSILQLFFEIEFPNINTDTMIFIIEKKYNLNNKIKLDIYEKRKYIVDQREYLDNENYEFLYEKNDYYRHIKNKIENESEFLGDISSTFTGFIGDSKKITKEKVKSSQIEIIKGENINKFNVSGKCYYEFLPENIKGGTKNMTKLKSPFKILVRKTGNKLISAIDSSGYIIEQSLYGIINLDNKYLHEYVLAILNSKLMEWYYLNFLVTNLNSTPQIKKYSLNRIPIKRCDLSEQKKIEKVVNDIIAAKKWNDINRIHELEMELDNTIFDLYRMDYSDRKIINLKSGVD